MSTDIFSFPRFKKEANGRVSFSKAVTIEKAITIDENNNKLSAVITTRNVDRDGDIVETEGIKLANFRKNPVVLWAHDHSRPPVAKVENLMVGQDQMMAEVKFADTAFGREIFSLYKGGFLNTFSIGFSANPDSVEPIFNKENDITGWHIGGSELLELSAVPVPANPEALVCSLEGFSSDVKTAFKSVEEDPVKKYMFNQEVDMVFEDTGNVDEKTKAVIWEATEKRLAETAYKKSIEERGKNGKIPVDITFGEKSSYSIHFEIIQEDENMIKEAKISHISIVVSDAEDAPSESDDDQDEEGRTEDKGMTKRTLDGAALDVEMMELELSVMDLCKSL